MTRPPSLRTLLLAGLVAVNVTVVAGVSALVWVRARGEAHQALRHELEVRAATFAGLLEVERDGMEFDLPRRAFPEYAETGTGAYAVIHDTAGRAVVRSPSLGTGDLAATGPWTEDSFAFAEVDEGPDGIPCATVTHSFVVRAQPASAADGWTPPPPESRRWQVVVAADSRARDARVQDVAVFLALIAGAALAVTVGGGLLVARSALRPIERLTAEAATLSPEDPSRRLRPGALARELQSLAETLNSALDRLGDALARGRRFASDASHELRTPLAVLLGNAELLLRRERAPAEYREGLERQRRVALRLTRITENLLALARADNGRAPAVKEPVEFGPLARRVCDEFASTASEGGVSLACDADAAASVLGDPTYLEVLVQNLVANAVKFTPRGGSVRVGVSAERGDAVLTVRDTGPGIPEGHLTRVFERFHRVREGTDPREGAGLGLAIVEWVARSHGGRAEAVSEPGAGAVFVVRIPLFAAAPATAPADS